MSAAGHPGEMVEPGAAGDEIEHWLRELKTDLSVDPPGWLESGAETADERAGDPTPPPTSVRGRHWAQE
jgi:hypothetical protein